jgi:hypothetical protein
VAEQTSGGRKSTAPGIDLEFENNGVYHLVSIKSSTNWGNSSQWGKLEQDFKKAESRLKQSRKNINVRSVLGVCYGKTKTCELRGFLKIVGQNFWYLISENKNLYIDIIEPLGYEAKKHNESFNKLKDEKINTLTNQFFQIYCKRDGSINWEKLVIDNCGNFDLDTYYN